jgi:hypothetical protein
VEEDSEKALGVEGRRKFGIPSLTSVVTRRLRLAPAPSKKRLRTKRQKRRM